MTPFATALAYAALGWPVFPCRWQEDDKRPLVDRWPERATINVEQISAWWERWSKARIGVPTGKAAGFVVLDVDIKKPSAYGFDTLDQLGFAILPITRMVHTGSGGLHLHFAAPAVEVIRNTVGEKGAGIGPGLDWRGEGGYVLVPSDGSGYAWDPVCGRDTPLAPVPLRLLPRRPERRANMRPVEPAEGLSPYARAALDSACRKITGAPNGEQEATLNAEAFSIGRLAGAGAIPEGFALRALLWAGSKISDHEPRRPWRPGDIENKIRRSFNNGVSQPRKARDHE